MAEKLAYNIAEESSHRLEDTKNENINTLEEANNNKEILVAPMNMGVPTIPEEESNATSSATSNALKTQDGGKSLQGKIQSLVQRFDSRRLRSEFFTLYLNRMHYNVKSTGHHHPPKNNNNAIGDDHGKLHSEKVATGINNSNIFSTNYYFFHT